MGFVDSVFRQMLPLGVILNLLTLVAASTSTMSAQQAFAAIWHDVELNALIGNGNSLVSLKWYAGFDLDHRPTLKIEDLVCKERRTGQRCRFQLHRVAHELAQQEDKDQPARLNCTADFERSPEDESGWEVVHYPPPRRKGHSRTTMKCKVQSTSN
jgi:hypothetical protein